MICINCENHNHENSDKFFYFILRHYKKTLKVRAFIKSQTKKNNQLKNILKFFEKDYDSEDVNKLIFKIFNMWNKLNVMRGKKLSNITFIQTLNVKFYNSLKYWIRVVLNPITLKIEFLFWINDFFIVMLKVNSKVCIFNCIYKTNRYNVFLVILTGVIELNTLFHSNICFIKRETIFNYKRLFGFINELYQHVDIFFSIV